MRHKSFGFTLLEILIALFIFTIISLILTNALHNVITTQANTEQRAQRLAELQNALLLISRDLEQTIDRPILRADNIQQGFIGTPYSVTFTRTGMSNPEGELPRSTLQRINYKLTQNKLVRTTWLMLDQTLDSKQDTRNLLNSVTEIEFNYLDHNNQFQKQWPSNDKDKTALPKAVKITLTLKKWGKLSQLYQLPTS